MMDISPEKLFTKSRKAKKGSLMKLSYLTFFIDLLKSTSVTFRSN